MDAPPCRTRIIFLKVQWTLMEPIAKWIWMRPFHCISYSDGPAFPLIDEFIFLWLRIRMILFQKKVLCTNTAVKSQVYVKFAPSLRLCSFGCSEDFHVGALWWCLMWYVQLGQTLRIVLDALTPIGREGGRERHFSCRQLLGRSGNQLGGSTM